MYIFFLGSAVNKTLLLSIQFVLGSLLISLIVRFFFFAQNRELVILATEAFSVRKERALQKVYSEMAYPKHTNISGWSSLSSCILSMLSAQYLT